MSSTPPPAPNQHEAGPQTVDTRSTWYRRAWVGWIGGILVGFLVGVAAGGGSAESPDQTGQEAPRATETVTVEAEPLAAETVTVEAEPQPAATVTVEAEPLPAETVTVEADPEAEPDAGNSGAGSYSAGQFTFEDVSVREDFVGDFEIRARVTNTGDAVSGVIWTVTLFSEGAVVGTASGAASDLAAKATTTQSFTSVDEFAEYDDIEFQVDTLF